MSYDYNAGGIRATVYSQAHLGTIRWLMTRRWRSDVYVGNGLMATLLGATARWTTRKLFGV